MQTYTRGGGGERHQLLLLWRWNSFVYACLCGKFMCICGAYEQEVLQESVPLSVAQTWSPEGAAGFFLKSQISYSSTVLLNSKARMWRKEKRILWWLKRSLSTWLSVSATAWGAPWTETWVECVGAWWGEGDVSSCSPLVHTTADLSMKDSAVSSCCLPSPLASSLVLISASPLPLSFCWVILLRQLMLTPPLSPPTLSFCCLILSNRRIVSTSLFRLFVARFHTP